MVNHRLRGAMLNAGLTRAALAGALGVDVKTVGRWLVEDRVPYPVTRIKMARVLNQQEAFLWPSLLERPEACDAAMAQLDGIWPTRTAISSDRWHELFSRATRQLDILVYAGDFLIETLDLADIVRWKAAHGTSVRVLIGEPVLARARELADLSLPDRCRLMLRYLATLAQAEGVEVKAHTTTVYASHFRFDDTLLINQHAFRAREAQSPVYRINASGEPSLLNFYVTAFDQTWAVAHDCAEFAQ